MPPQGAKTDFALCHADLQILSGQLKQKVAKMAKMAHFLFSIGSTFGMACFSRYTAILLSKEETGFHLYHCSSSKLTLI